MDIFVYFLTTINILYYSSRYTSLNESNLREYAPFKSIYVKICVLFKRFAALEGVCDLFLYKRLNKT
ncbi:hypothetical protein QE152_g10379 [Popillia japonica]|uniref:Uncharacterized protein n=1 Tax=Popillia japonica TaxID=7064 RepID=A0AAW1LVX7_POPJA